MLPKYSRKPPKTPPRGAPEASWRRLGRQLCSLGALLAALGTLLGHSLDALGRSRALLTALQRSWDSLRTRLARFKHLQGSILSSPELLQEVSEQPKGRTFRKSAESCPRTVREDSKNQILQRWIASSLLYLFAKKLGAGGLAQRTK